MYSRALYSTILRLIYRISSIINSIINPKKCYISHPQLLATIVYLKLFKLNYGFKILSQTQGRSYHRGMGGAIAPPPPPIGIAPPKLLGN